MKKWYWERFKDRFPDQIFLTLEGDFLRWAHLEEYVKNPGYNNDRARLPSFH